MTLDIASWLASIGLPRYADAFHAHDIDASLLPGLSADELREIGVASLGHRKRILEAIAALATGTQPPAPQPSPPGTTPARHAYTPRHLSERILQSRSAMEGERKQVSVLFADVQGSMELAAQLDPEQWHAVLEGFFAILTEGVHRFEGTVNQYTGDGIMALFGAPIAHEDHAQRACFAALHLQGEIARYATAVRRTHGVGFSTRMGINSGEVVVGRIGDDLRMDYTAQGHTVGLAQRMEALAEPNSCFLAPSTAALAGGYLALEDLGEFRVKGVADKLRVHRLLGAGAARTRLDLSRQRGLTSFIGREAELRELDAALVLAGAGQGQVVGVVAEAGTGKSRLCFEFLALCRARGLQVAEGRAVAQGAGMALLPVRELFRSVFALGAQEPARSAREKIAGRLVLIDPALAAQLPLLFDFLGVGDAPAMAPDADPRARQQQLVALLARLVRGGEDAPPTVALLEDLHWLDEASGEFLQHLVQACAHARCLLLLNFRPGYRAAWVDQPWYRQLALAPLGPQAMAVLVAGLLGPDPGIASLAGEIHARTGGNPFFAEEMIRTLVESGQLQGSPGDYRLTTPIPLLAVPPTVQAVLAARIDRLPDSHKQMLQLAAVVGKEFNQPLLAQVAGWDAALLPPVLGALEAGGFIQALASEPLAGFSFRHPLTLEVALASQLRERRRQTHARVAQAIEQLDAARLDERAALLAHHWEEAGDVGVAAGWHQRAAESPGCLDFRTAMQHWERVRVLLRAAPDGPDVLALRITACTRLLTMGQRVGADAQASRELHAEGQLLVQASGDPRAHIRLSMAYGWAQMSTGDTAACLDRMDALQPLLASTGDPALQAAVWGNRVLLHCFAARFPQALALADQGRALLQSAPAAGHGLGSLNADATLGQFRGYALAWLGRTAEALDAYRQSLRLADAVGELAVFARCHCAEIHYHLGDAQAALDHARQAQQVSQALGQPQMLEARVQVAMAHALLAAGQAADAVPAARRALAIHQAMDRVHAGLSAWILAEALLQSGDAAAALGAAQDAIGCCRLSLRANYEALAQGVLARALLRRDGAPAIPAARAALEQADACICQSGAALLAPALAQWRAELLGCARAD